MTDQKPPPTRVTPDPDSRLARLVAERAALAPAVSNAKKRLKDIEDAIKIELTNAAPDSANTVATVPGCKPVRLAWQPRPQFQEKAFKEAHPDLAQRFTDQDAGFWSLREVSS